MKNILELESKLRLRLITGEFELLSWLYFNGPTKSRDLAVRTKTSIANFQIILRRLKSSNIILSLNTDDDRRVRVYDLAPEIRAEFDMIFTTDPEGNSILMAVRGRIENSVVSNVAA
jgi:DNA-binding MarR family transcriptional regulator